MRTRLLCLLALPFAFGCPKKTEVAQNDAGLSIAKPAPLVPKNPELKKALADYAADAGSRETVLAALTLAVPLLAVEHLEVPLDEEDRDAGKPRKDFRYLMLELDGGTLLPVFTDLEALRRFSADAGYSGLRGDHIVFLAQHAKVAGLLLDVESPARMEVTQRELNELAAKLPRPKQRKLPGDNPHEDGDGEHKLQLTTAPDGGLAPAARDAGK